MHVTLARITQETGSTKKPCFGESDEGGVKTPTLRDDNVGAERFGR
ncbi:hypothetical protein [Enterovibrio sp. 27052020O]